MHHFIKAVTKNSARSSLKTTKELAETVVKTAPKPKAKPKPPKAPRSTQPKPPPKPKQVQAEPISPRQAELDRGQELIEADRQRKRNGQRPLTQEEYTIKNNTEIDRVRGEIESARETIQRFDENLPGTSLKDKKEIPEYKVARKLVDSKSGYLSSIQSNRLVPGEGRAHAYKTESGSKTKANKDLQSARVQDLHKRGIKIQRPGEQIDLHHLVPKGMTSAFFEHMEYFKSKQMATDADIIEMAEIAQAMGLEPGDVQTSIVPIPQRLHTTSWELHSVFDNTNSQVFKGQKIEIDKTVLKKLLRKAKTPKELKRLWKEWLEKDAKWMFDTGKNWENLDIEVGIANPTRKNPPPRKAKKKSSTKV